MGLLGRRQGYQGCVRVWINLRAVAFWHSKGGTGRVVAAVGEAMGNGYDVTDAYPRVLACSTGTPDDALIHGPASRHEVDMELQEALRIRPELRSDMFTGLGVGTDWYANDYSLGQ